MKRKPKLIKEIEQGQLLPALEKFFSEHGLDVPAELRASLAAPAVEKGQMELLDDDRPLTPLEKSLAKLNATRAARRNGSDTDPQDAAADLVEPAQDGQRKSLSPVRHINRDFFLADMVDYAFKDDAATMEAPVFSLSTKPDLSTWKWESQDGKKRMEVTPSALGRASIHDKDVLIYVTSQMTEALNFNAKTGQRPDAKSRVVRFTAYDYLVTTNRHTSGREYAAFEKALRRLSGTRIYTNIETGGVRVKRDFGLIDSWEIVEKSPDDERMIAVEVTLSEWLYNAIQAHEVLTLHPDYFRLRKPTDRRIYELARKHCGHQAQWSISLPLLHQKSGSGGTIYEFFKTVKELAREDHLPEYRIHLTDNTRLDDVKVTFYTKDMQRFAKSILGKA